MQYDPSQDTSDGGQKCDAEASDQRVGSIDGIGAVLPEEEQIDECVDERNQRKEESEIVEIVSGPIQISWGIRLVIPDSTSVPIIS